MDATASVSGVDPSAASWSAWWRWPFEIEQRWSWWVFGCWCAVNLVTATAVLLHHPYIMYDAGTHAAYFITLGSGQLPGFEHTGEFFSPPLPYLLPALTDGLGMPELVSYKLNHLLQILEACLLSLYLLRLARRLDRRGAAVRLLSLVFVVMVPAYHRSFAMVRGEPLVAMFTLILIDGVLEAVQRPRLTLRWGLWLGVLGGLMVLSRQWGVLVLLGVVFFGLIQLVMGTVDRRRLALTMAVAAVLSVLIAGPFYLRLKLQYGSFTAFNRPVGHADSRKDAGFYLGLRPGVLLTRPVLPNLDMHAPAIYYADVWGDYWGCWLVRGINDEGAYARGKWNYLKPVWLSRTNYDAMACYLGTVMAVALVPTVLWLIGCLWAGWRSIRSVCSVDSDPDVRLADSLVMLVLSVIVAGFLGYGWFCVVAPTPNGDTIKAIYTLQLFPLLGLLASGWIARLAYWQPAAGRAVIVLLLLAGLYLSPTWLSRYLPPWYGFFPRQVLNVHDGG